MPQKAPERGVPFGRFMTRISSLPGPIEVGLRVQPSVARAWPCSIARPPSRPAAYRNECLRCLRELLSTKIRAAAPSPASAALECYRSSDYANAMALREGKSEMDLVIIEGYDGPQPTVLSVPSTVEGRALVSKFHSACHRNCLPRPGRSLVGRLPWFFDCSRI